MLADSGGAGAATLAGAAASARAAGAAIERILVLPPNTAGADAQLAEQALRLCPLGTAYSRNRALRTASAPLVAFLDGGCRPAAGWVQAVLEAFARTRVPAGATGPILLEHDSRGGRDVPSSPLGWALAPAANLAFRRDALLALGGFDASLGRLTGPAGPDLDLLLRLRGAGGRLTVAPEMIVHAPRPTAAQGFRDARAVGAALRRRRRVDLAARYAAHGVVRSRRPALVGGLVAGLLRGESRTSPVELLELMPGSVRRSLSGALPRPLPASPGRKTHLMYEVRPGRILHLYADPSERLERALGEREAIRAGAGAAGIPALLDAGASDDALWVLEERVPGAAPSTRRPRDWFPAVTSWAVAMAGPPRRPLRETPFWEAHAAAAVAAAPQELRLPVEAALTGLAAVPARHLHGDFQPRNIRIAGTSVGAIDWEGAWAEGLPGLDLVFLALLAGGSRPDEEILRALAAGTEPRWGPLLGALERVGIAPSILRAALLSMLAVWALAEELRLRRLAEPHGERPFRRLLVRHGPELA